MTRRNGMRYYINQHLPDLVFFAAAVLLTVYYLRLSRCGVNVRDEWSFIVVAQRLINGDPPIVHDRTPVILSCFFLYPPVRLFYWITGSYTGVVLFIRWLFVAIHAVFSSAVYLSLRRYRWFAVFAAVNYMCFIPNEIYSPYYNSICLMGVTLMCLLLFIGKEPGKFRLVGAGIAFACAVMALPQLAVLYVIWTAFVFITALINRKKNISSRTLPIYAELKGWAVITAAVAVCALCVIVGLLTRTTLPDLLAALPDFISYARFTSQRVFRLSRFVNFLHMTGNVPPFLLLVLFIAAAADRQRYRRRAFYLTAASAALAWIYVSLYLYYFRGGAFINGKPTYSHFLPINMRAAPFYIIGFFAFVLTKKKNGRLFSFLAVCAAFSVLRDLTSHIVVGLGGAGADIAAALLLHELFKEWRTQNSAAGHNISQKRLTALVCVLPVCLAFFSECTWKIVGRNFSLIESICTTQNTAPDKELIDGPMQGIFTITKGKFIYQNTLEDLEPLKKTAGSVYIAGMPIFGYLYLDLPCPADSTAFDPDKAEEFLLSYWEKYPEKTPDCIYISFYDMDCLSMDTNTAEQLLAFFRNSFSFTLEKGKAGYILKDVRPV